MGKPRLARCVLAEESSGSESIIPFVVTGTDGSSAPEYSREYSLAVDVSITPSESSTTYEPSFVTGGESSMSGESSAPLVVAEGSAPLLATGPDENSAPEYSREYSLAVDVSSAPGESSTLYEPSFVLGSESSMTGESSAPLVVDDSSAPYVITGTESSEPGESSGPSIYQY
jgi:hypothetical protein